MKHPRGPGGRAVDITILRELGDLDPLAASARELADRLASPPGTTASKLRSLVKAGLVQVHWGAGPDATRAYAITEAGCRYLLDVSAA